MIVLVEDPLLVRSGLERKVKPIMDDTNIYDYVNKMDRKIYCVLIDEAQFLKEERACLTINQNC